jgi:hypothetical protein
MNTLSQALIPLSLSLALAQAASAQPLPASFSCYPVEYRQAGQPAVSLNSERAFKFVRAGSRTYQMGTDGDDQPYLLELDRDPEEQTWGIARFVPGRRNEMTTEFALDFLSDRILETSAGKMAMVSGLRELDIGFQCAIPLADFRALGGRFEVADEDDSANHQTCALYNQPLLDRHDDRTAYVRDLLIGKGYHLVRDPKAAEFTFSFGEIQYCYDPHGKGPPWWLFERGYSARLNAGPSQEYGSHPGPTVWEKSVDSVVLFKIDLATNRFYRKLRKIPSCGAARKLVSEPAHP